jgi:PKD repeat protein
MGLGVLVFAVAGSPAAAKPAAGIQCSGPTVKIFDNSNGFGVLNGGKSPTFSTKGKGYCVTQIVTYHWNNGAGKKPGTIGLTGSSTVGPTKATGSSGQNNAQNVNWTVNYSTSKPVGIDGTYSCVDSDPASWSQNQQSKGGFCIVYGTAATGVPAPAPAPKVTYACTGGVVKIFDNSNGFGVQNGAGKPSFTTKGKSYCLASITTYHWNGGKGATPGTLGLSGTTTVTPIKAKGSAGQGGAQNVDWTATFSTAKPTVINGTYSCVDSDFKTWSQNQGTQGKGFCIVYGVNAVKKTGAAATTTTTKKKAATKPKAKPTTTTTKKSSGKKSNKLAIKASPDTGKPPLTVTFTLSSPKVVQWRVDFGDGQSKVAIGQPPATLSHTYAKAGGYVPRLTVITSQSATAASSATTNVTVGAALMTFTATPASGNPPLTVTFALGTTATNITTWSVDYGDGSQTSGVGKPPASVSHSYKKAGTYRATFSVKPGAYALVASFAQITVGGGTPPVLSLTAAPTSGKHPLAVKFTIGTNIPGKIVSWQLQYGDGQQAGGSGTPPATASHTYAKAGTYAAYLVVVQQQQYGGVQYIVPRGGLVVSVS